MINRHYWFKSFVFSENYPLIFNSFVFKPLMRNVLMFSLGLTPFYDLLDGHESVKSFYWPLQTYKNKSITPPPPIISTGGGTCYFFTRSFSQLENTSVLVAHNQLHKSHFFLPANACVAYYLRLGKSDP